MYRVEKILAEWQQLHKRLESTRLRLKEVGDGAARKVLEAEVLRLKQEDDAAISAVHAALATVKTRSEGPVVATDTGHRLMRPKG